MQTNFLSNFPIDAHILGRGKYKKPWKNKNFVRLVYSILTIDVINNNRMLAQRSPFE